MEIGKAPAEDLDGDIILNSVGGWALGQTTFCTLAKKRLVKHMAFEREFHL
jgi:hypothetical protein